MKYLNFKSPSPDFKDILEFNLVKHDAPNFLYNGEGILADPLHSPGRELNSNGFRSPEFSSVDLITLGCSQTLGMGVCFDFIWPKLLSEKLGNVSYANLAYPGWSTTRMVKEFFAYVNKYGTPKFLSILLPDLYRYLFVTTGSVNSGYRKDKNKNMAPPMEGDFTLPVSKDFHWKEELLPKLSKMPHALEDILTPDFTYYQNLTSLYQLLVFCEATEITVSLSSWHMGTFEILKELETKGLSSKILPPYVYAEEFICSTLNGHPDLETKLIHSNEFHQGVDRGEHMGAHSHWHVADEMYNILKDQLDL